MDRITKSQFEDLQDLIYADPAKALDLLLHFEDNYSDDPNLITNIAGFLIEIGAASKNSDVLQRGIGKLESEYEGSGNLDPTQWYNLGNGLYAAEAIKRGPSNEYDPVGTTMAAAKECYRKALDSSAAIPDDLLIQLKVNYANCLGELGRSVDAIREYNDCLQYDSKNPMLLGSLGRHLCYFADISHDRGLLEEADKLLSAALNGDALEQSGHGHTRPAFARNLKIVQEQLRKNPRRRKGAHPKPSLKTKNEREFVAFCVEHELFLNFSLKGMPSRHPYEDELGINLVTPIDQEAQFHRLLRTMNEVKERYSIARISLFEAHSPPYDFQLHDEITPYTDIFDFSTRGFRSAKLKLAFETAFNIFDKIAFFINEYLGIGVDGTVVNFHNLWKASSRDKVLRPEIHKLNNNLHLFGLYDVSRDLAKNGYFYRLRVLRNKLTHSYLILHYFQDCDWFTASDGEPFHIGYREFFSETIKLLQLVREAIIYLAAFIDQEERTKIARFEGKVAEIGSWRSTPIDFGPQDSPI